MLYPYANSEMITAGYNCNAMYDNGFNDLQWAAIISNSRMITEEKTRECDKWQNVSMITR
jgi:hypothetical protein